MIHYEITSPGELSDVDFLRNEELIPVYDEDMQAVVAKDDEKVIGALFFLVEESSCNMSYLYVTEPYRGCGVGLMLHHNLREYLYIDDSIKKIYTDLPAEGDFDTDYLSSLGYDMEYQDHYKLELQLKDALELDFMKRKLAKLDETQKESIKSLSTCTIEDLTSLGICMKHTPWELNLTEMSGIFEEECSMIHFSEEKTVDGFLLLEKDMDDIRISFLYVEPEVALSLADLLVVAAKKTIEKYGSQIKLLADVRSKGFQLANKLGIPYSASPVLHYVCRIRQ